MISLIIRKTSLRSQENEELMVAQQRLFVIVPEPACEQAPRQSIDLFRIVSIMYRYCQFLIRKHAKNSHANRRGM